MARRGIPVEPALASGQMMVAGCEGCLLSGQAFSAGEAMRWLSGQMAASQQGGLGGLRIAMDMSWALRPVSRVEELPAFKEGMAAALAGTTASVCASTTGRGSGWPARSTTGGRNRWRCHPAISGTFVLLGAATWRESAW